MIENPCTILSTPRTIILGLKGLMLDLAQLMILLLVESQTTRFRSRNEDGVERKTEQEDLDDEAGNGGIVGETL